ncbi:4047_t:CDS:1, partial [Dentiscutata erythropus]
DIKILQLRLLSKFHYLELFESYLKNYLNLPWGGEKTHPFYNIKFG